MSFDVLIECYFILFFKILSETNFNNKLNLLYQPDLMYYWAHTLALQTSDTLPGKLNVQLWPFSSQANASAERPSLGISYKKVVI